MLELLSDISRPSIRRLALPLQNHDSPMPTKICQSLFSPQNLSAHSFCLLRMSLWHLFLHQKTFRRLKTSVKVALTILIYKCFPCSVSMASRNTICSHFITLFPMYYIRISLQLIICMSCLPDKNVSSFASKKFHTMSAFISVSA